mmetsp:Transcript_43086/g.99209  ORF Transcript_43086/g.99209 Transcript_43086/m.99209 type:complete len:255 (+) Transcript_43086:1917-2681(+)
MTGDHDPDPPSRHKGPYLVQLTEGPGFYPPQSICVVGRLAARTSLLPLGVDALAHRLLSRAVAASPILALAHARSRHVGAALCLSPLALCHTASASLHLHVAALHIHPLLSACALFQAPLGSSCLCFFAHHPSELVLLRPAAIFVFSPPPQQPLLPQRVPVPRWLQHEQRWLPCQAPEGLALEQWPHTSTLPAHQTSALGTLAPNWEPMARLVSIFAGSQYVDLCDRRRPVLSVDQQTGWQSFQTHPTGHVHPR